MRRTIKNCCKHLFQISSPLNFPNQPTTNGNDFRRVHGGNCKVTEISKRRVHSQALNVWVHFYDLLVPRNVFGSFLADCCDHLFWTDQYIGTWITRAWSRECYTHDIFRWFLWLYSHHHPTKKITLCNIGWLEIIEKIRRRYLAINVYDLSLLFFSTDICDKVIGT